jgi:phosphate transport system permease protein
LPQSLSGILTGTIIGLAQAIGETAPLIIVGLVAFVPAAADGMMSDTTVLPVQIFQWFSRSQPGFRELTAAAILVLLAVLLTMNATAVLLRARFEKRW